MNSLRALRISGFMAGLYDEGWNSTHPAYVDGWYEGNAVRRENRRRRMAGRRVGLGR